MECSQQQLPAVLVTQNYEAKGVPSGAVLPDTSSSTFHKLIPHLAIHIKVVTIRCCVEGGSQVVSFQINFMCCFRHSSALMWLIPPDSLHSRSLGTVVHAPHRHLCGWHSSVYWAHSLDNCDLWALNQVLLHQCGEPACWVIGKKEDKSLVYLHGQHIKAGLFLLPWTLVLFLPTSHLPFLILGWHGQSGISLLHHA